MMVLGRPYLLAPTSNPAPNRASADRATTAAFKRCEAIMQSSPGSETEYFNSNPTSRGGCIGLKSAIRIRAQPLYDASWSLHTPSPQRPGERRLSLGS